MLLRHVVLWLLERPGIVWLLLFPVAVAYTLPFLWGGDDVWEMAAAIRAASENFLDPRNPMLDLPGETSPRFTPYVIFWGAVMKASGASIFSIIKVSALVNFFLFATGFTRFITGQFGDKRLATVLVPVMLFVWGTSYGQANAYNFWFFFFTLPLVAIFAYGVGFHGLSELALFLKDGRRSHVVRYAVLSTIVFLSHPVTGLFVFVIALAMVALDKRRLQALALQTVPLFALVCALIWPYFDYGNVLFSGAIDKWYDPEMFSNQFLALGPALAGVIVAVYFAVKRRHLFAVVLLALFSFAYFASWSLDILIGERFLLFSAFALHLLIALFVLEVIENFVRAGGLKSKTLKWQLICVLLIAICALPFREQDVRMTGSLMISTFVKRRHGETMREQYQFLQQHLYAGDVVLAEGMDAWPLPGLTGARTVFQRHGNPLLVRELEVRLQDTNEFLSGNMLEAERENTIVRYGVTHVLLNVKEPASIAAGLPTYLHGIGYQVAEQDSLVLFQISK